MRYRLKSGKICKNNDHICLFIALSLAGSAASCSNSFLLDPANANAYKTYVVSNFQDCAVCTSFTSVFINLTDKINLCALDNPIHCRMLLMMRITYCFAVVNLFRLHVLKLFIH